ncbi:hypothetical protein MASR1M107_01480 [Ignavibacteriales bacterium]
MKKIFLIAFLTLSCIIYAVMITWNFTKDFSSTIPWDLQKGDTVKIRSGAGIYFLPRTISMSGNGWAETFEYDNKGKLIRFERKQMSPEETISIKNSYNEKGKLVASLKELRNGFGIASSTIDSISYNSNGDTSSTLFEEYQFGYKKNTLKTTFSYDNSRKLTTKLTETLYWNVWINSSRQSFTYDAKNRFSSIINELWEYNNWVKSSQTSFKHDDNGNRTNFKFESFKAGVQDSGFVVSTSYSTFGYKATEETEKWSGGKWEKLEKLTYAYDDSGKLTNKLAEEFIDNAWVKSSNLTVRYDPSGRVFEELRESWSKGALVISEKTKFELDEVSGNVRQVSEINRDGTWTKSNWMTLKYDKNHNFVEVITDPGYKSAKNIVAYFNNGTEFMDIHSSTFDVILQLNVAYHEIKAKKSKL